MSYNLDAARVSPLHDMISHSSYVLFVDDLKSSRDFYHQLGFRLIHVDTMMYVVRLKHVYIELWDNAQCKLNRPKYESEMEKAHRSIHIEVRTEERLKNLHAIYLEDNITVVSHCWDGENPIGKHFKIHDPDGNPLYFCSGRGWSDESEYQSVCVAKDQMGLKVEVLLDNPEYKYTDSVGSEPSEVSGLGDLDDLRFLSNTDDNSN
ncbi:MAG: hypothetical protein COA42_10445 [Alteromonadaceae bacterium]|nr:MAG: hypothetical protein COA42_10445 [Alteromonadaceae bacterium]